MPANCLSAFDHFVGLALKGLSNTEAERKKSVALKKKYVMISCRETFFGEKQFTNISKKFSRCFFFIARD